MAFPFEASEITVTVPIKLFRFYRKQSYIYCSDVNDSIVKTIQTPFANDFVINILALSSHVLFYKQSNKPGECDVAVQRFAPLFPDSNLDFNPKLIIQLLLAFLSHFQ